MKPITQYGLIGLMVFGVLYAMGQVGDLARLREVAQRFEAVTLHNPSKAKEELSWLLGDWQCVALAFPQIPDQSDSYAMLGRMKIVPDALFYPGHYPDSVLIYSQCYYTTNIPGYRRPKDEIALCEFRQNDFIYRHGDFFFLKRPMTNNPSAFLLEHKNGGGLLLFQRVETPCLKVEDAGTNHAHALHSAMTNTQPMFKTNSILPLGKFNLLAPTNVSDALKK